MRRILKHLFRAECISTYPPADGSAELAMPLPLPYMRPIITGSRVSLSPRARLEPIAPRRRIRLECTAIPRPESLSGVHMYVQAHALARTKCITSTSAISAPYDVMLDSFSELTDCMRRNLAPKFDQAAEL